MRCSLDLVWHWIARVSPMNLMWLNFVLCQMYHFKCIQENKSTSSGSRELLSVSQRSSVNYMYAVLRRVYTRGYKPAYREPKQFIISLPYKISSTSRPGLYTPSLKSEWYVSGKSLRQIVGLTGI